MRTLVFLVTLGTATGAFGQFNDQSTGGENCCYFHQIWDYNCYDCCEDSYSQCVSYCHTLIGEFEATCETSCENGSSDCELDCNGCVIEDPLASTPASCQLPLQEAQPVPSPEARRRESPEATKALPPSAPGLNIVAAAVLAIAASQTCQVSESSVGSSDCCYFDEVWNWPCNECCTTYYVQCVQGCQGLVFEESCETGCEWGYSNCDELCFDCMVDDPT